MKQMHLEDAAAVARATAGDQDAFRELVDRHSRSVYRLAYRMTGSAADAEDVVQDTFVRAYRQLAKFEARSNFGTWLYRIGFNCAIDHLRSRPQRESAQDARTSWNASRRPRRARAPRTWFSPDRSATGCRRR